MGKDINIKIFISQLKMFEMVHFKMFKKWSRARFYPSCNYSRSQCFGKNFIS